MSGERDKGLEPPATQLDTETEGGRTLLREPNLAATLPHLGPHNAPGAGQGATAGGRFQVVRFHARGGLGEVFVARDQELNRDVALKQIKDEFAYSASYRARFLVEAEVTGALEHPGIVPVYGLGQDADGRPFYAMRFIQGDTLKDATDRFHQAQFPDPGAQELELRKLLRRFLDVCNTIAYAHSRGVLHRDLKPNNVMLGPYGETLVVDWGLAKVVGSPEAEPAPAPDSALPVKLSSGSDVVATEMGDRIGTPAYMSPEQAEGRLDRLGPASDVYSLGATLYSLLTGRGPFEDRKILPALLEAVRRGDFPRPRALAPHIPPALEAICLKAMAVRPEDRYVTPRALAEDLDRWLADEPVSAWREPWSDRARRWLKRHRTGVTGLVIASVLAAAGLGAVTVQRELSHRQLQAANRRVEEALKRAEGRVDLALRAIGNFQRAVEDNLDVKDRPELKPLRKALLQTPMEFYRQLRKDLQSSRETRPESLEQLADAAYQFAAITNEIDSQSRAIEGYREAIAALGPLAAAHGSHDRVRRDLADSFRGLGYLLAATGQPDEALRTCRHALEIQEALVATHPRDDELRSGLAACYNDLAHVLSSQGKHDEARQSYLRALEIREALLAARPEDRRRRKALGLLLSNLGTHDWETRRYGPSIDAYQRALTYITDEDDRYAIYFGLAKSYDAIDRLNLTETYHRKALEVAERLARAHPTVTEYQSDLARSHNHLGSALRQDGKLSEAEAAFRTSVKILEDLIREHPDLVDLRLYQGAALRNVGFVVEQQHGAARALADFDRAIAAYEEVIARRGTGTQKATEFLAYTLRDRGFAYDALERPDEALADFDRALRIDPGLFGVYGRRGRIREARGDYAAALADYDTAIRVAPRRAFTHAQRAWLLATCPEAKYRNGAEAVASARRACELTEWKDADTLDTLAAASAESGDFDAAVRWETRAIELTPQNPDQAPLRARLDLYRQKRPYRDQR
jgi:serine/threonine-protein kinase